MTTVNIDGVSREMTAEEQAEYDAQQLAWETTGKKSLQLKSIRELRNQKLSETDYLATSDNVMSDEMKAFRKSMRDVPQNFDEDKYDELLARDIDGNLTHTIWEKP